MPVPHYIGRVGVGVGVAVGVAVGGLGLEL